MRGGTLFSGIGAPEQAMPWVDWRWCAEFEPFACAVLAARHPGVTNLGDVTEVDWRRIADRNPVDLMVFGSPCQSFSVAGKRLGLDDPRGNLALVALGVVRILQPKFLVFENVPGLLSSAGGRDFGAFLGQVEDCGYGWAYRTLDAQFFGVPQRRRRVFVVGYRDPVNGVGDWRVAAAILFEQSSLSGHPATGRAARSEVARTVTCRARDVGGQGSNDRTFVGSDGRPLNALCMAHGQANAEVQEDRAPTLSCNHEAPILVGPLCAHSAEHGHAMTTQQAAEAGHIVTHPLTARHDSSPDGTGRGVPIVPVAFDSKRNPNPGDVAPALRAMGADGGHANGGGQFAVAYQCHGGNVGPMGTLRTGSGNVTSGVPFTFQPRVGRSGRGMPTDVVPALAGGSAGTGATSDMRPCVVARYAVRRLTPRECERLQAFPDDYTLVPFRGRPAKDGPRYRALGNSMCVNVMAWIGRRIQIVEAILTTDKTPAIAGVRGGAA